MTKVKTLANGLKVIMIPMPNSLTTTVLVLTKTGSKYETKNINGISHFLEHLIFKGTEKDRIQGQSRKSLTDWELNTMLSQVMNTQDTTRRRKRDILRIYLMCFLIYI